MSLTDDQQFCLRWNNFQANITSQFETLRDDEDFTDVTIACEGQRLQAHKVVLSACSPYFKELFKSNPCPHPIIFMRDVEAQHIVALMEFMYAGEVNVAQAHLSTFLKTAESLRIRGLTDTSPSTENYKEKDEDAVFTNSKPPSSKHHLSSSHATKHRHKSQISSTSTVTSSQDVPSDKVRSPPPKRQCKNEHLETDLATLREELPIDETASANHFASQSDEANNLETDILKSPVHPKIELPDYLSDDDRDEAVHFFHSSDGADIPGGMEIIPHTPSTFLKDTVLESNSGALCSYKRKNSRSWSPNDNNYITEKLQASIHDDRNCRSDINEYSNGRNKLVKLGEGIEIYEDQLRSVKWSDYRKLTRGLATILFSPAELATCSVTGQRWSRAGSGERPVKPALNKAKVQAIISYVTTRFPTIEISRIKQVLAYKCKENSTALKMKAVRYYNDLPKDMDK